MADSSRSNEEFRAEDKLTGALMPPRISQIVSRDEPKQGIDLAHYQDVYPDTDPVVINAIEELDAYVKANAEALLLDYTPIHRSPFLITFELRSHEWREEFGDPPDGLESWDPVWEAYNGDFVATWEIQNDASIDESDYARVVDSDDSHIFSIDASYATELSVFGLLTLPESKAYFLRLYGYSDERIAELLDVSVSDASALSSRSRKKLQRVNHTSGVVDHAHDEISEYGYALDDKCGSLYWEPGLDQHVFIDRLENWGGREDPFYVFMVLFEDGEYTDVGTARVPLCMECESDREPEFEEPFDSDRLTHDLSEIQALEAGESL